MFVPTFLIGPTLGLRRYVQERRRKVKLTVHRAYFLRPLFAAGGGDVVTDEGENLCITVTNASPTREVVVTHVWLETVPPVHVYDPGLPVRLKYGQPWETVVPVSDLPEGTERPEWLARCMITPDDKVIRSKPRKNVPPVGAVPRGAQ